MSGPVDTHFTEFGLTGIRAVPYGAHLCMFYASRQDLIDCLVPYFQAGLRNNERALWVTAEPLLAREAMQALAQSLPETEEMLSRDQLRIIDAADWYAAKGELSADDVIAGWLREEANALAAGYRGLRITGNTSFVTPAQWDGFMDYEATVSEAIAKRRILALCTYSRSQCAGAEMLDVVHTHHCAIGRSHSAWEVIT